jgi:hypothetical protein
MMSLRIVVALVALFFASMTEARLEGHDSGRDLGSTCEDYAKFYDRCCEDVGGTADSGTANCNFGFLTGLPGGEGDYPNCCCPVRNNIAKSAWDSKCEKIKSECDNLGRE